MTPTARHRKRQAFPPVPSASTAIRADVCAINCLTATPAEECQALDAACLCYDKRWHTDILMCLQASCSTPFGLDTAYSQLREYCAAAGTPFETPKPSFTNTIAAAEFSATATFLPTSPDDIPSLFGNTPIQQPVNVSAIMAAVCSLLLAGSFVIGYFSVKARLKRSRAEKERAQKGGWGGATQLNTLSSQPGGNQDKASKPKSKVQKLKNQLTSSMFNGTDTVDSFADREREAREERIDAARLKREEEAERVRQRTANKNSLFLDASAASASPSTTSLNQLNPDSDSYSSDNKNRFSVSLSSPSGPSDRRKPTLAPSPPLAPLPSYRTNPVQDDEMLDGEHAQYVIMDADEDGGMRTASSGGLTPGAKVWARGEEEGEGVGGQDWIDVNGSRVTLDK